MKILFLSNVIKIDPYNFELAYTVTNLVRSNYRHVYCQLTAFAAHPSCRFCWWWKWVRAVMILLH